MTNRNVDYSLNEFKNISMESFVIPKAKKNLHECIYHLNDMKKLLHAEKFQINFAAFVNSARNVTFVLQKEYSDNTKFKNWYLNKQIEMKHDDLCKYFLDTRNYIIKEGINGLNFSYSIKIGSYPEDCIDRPSEPHSMIICNEGVYYIIKERSREQDQIPAIVKSKATLEVNISNSPKKHLNQDISTKNIIELCEIYYSYLKNLVEEWTEVLNSR